jgi:hypothetical protein
MSNEDSFVVENLEITDEDFLNLRKNTNELDTDTEISAPVYYSYPYYVLNGSDYQYKLSFDEGSLKLEEVKTTDEELGMREIDNMDYERSICIIKEHELDEGLRMIEQKLDIRKNYIDAETLDTDPKWGDILELDISQFNKEEAASALENNKKIVLLDLYNYISNQ